MGDININLEKEYQIHWKINGLFATRIDYFEIFEDAEKAYLEKRNNPNVSYVELLECKTIKAHEK